jgi:hypothetical protein
MFAVSGGRPSRLRVAVAAEIQYDVMAVWSTGPPDPL